MGRIARLQPVLRFAAIYANRLESLQWARDQMESVWGGHRLEQSRLAIHGNALLYGFDGIRFEKTIACIFGITQS